MKAPPFLIGAVLLFWGWQTHLLPLGIGMAIAAEGGRLMKAKWDLSRAEWSHVTDLCTLILLSIVTVGFFRDKARIIFDVGKLFPCIFLPLLIAQQYSVKDKVDLMALSLMARKQSKKRERLLSVNISYPYFIVCLLSAGIGNVVDGSYFIGIYLIGGWAAFSIRSKHVPLFRWVALALLIGAMGLLGGKGLSILQQRMLELSSQLLAGDTNPLKASTAIGDIGTQKMYSYIVFRAKPDKRPTPPLLLREAAYNLYRSPNWLTLNADLENAFAKNETLQLSKPKGLPHYAIDIQTKLKKGKATLKIPGGTYEIQNISGDLQTNTLGSITLENGQKGLINYRTLFSPHTSHEAPPSTTDLDVPETEQEAINQIIQTLQLEGKPPDQIISELSEYFNTEYSYTLNHQGKGKRNTPLAFFLLDRKAGHCELFATATVLILRACDIPARYAVGYVAAEYSALEQQFIIRQRHGHAWTRYYINGQWTDLDTTSSNWLELEEENQSPFRFMADFADFIAFKLAQFRWSEKNYMEKLAIGLLFVLILMIANRLRKQKKSKRAKKAKSKKRAIIKRVGLNSDFYRLEQQLAHLGYPRNPGEPLILWALRIQKAAPDLLDFAILHHCIYQHYQYRFSSERSRKRKSTPIKIAIDNLIQSLK